jgi:hypothetical protein
MLGLYKVGEAGVDVDVVVDTSMIRSGGRPDARRVRASRRTGAVHAGALHAHTDNSDGADAPAARRQGTRREADFPRSPIATTRCTRSR